MPRTTLSTLALLLFLVAASAGASAQVAAEAGTSPDGERPNLIAALDLTPEQLEQIRRVNAGRRPVLRAAQLRLREASRDLDAAIYSDTPSDADVELRLKEFQAAQRELAGLRFAGEYAVRKILTPEQLVRFRELRRSFAERKGALRRFDRRMPRRILRDARPTGF